MKIEIYICYEYGRQFKQGSFANLSDCVFPPYTFTQLSKLIQGEEKEK